MRKVKDVTYTQHIRIQRMFGFRPLNPIKFLLWKYGFIKSYSEKMREKEEMILDELGLAINKV